MLSAEKGTLNEMSPDKNLSPVQTDATLLANNSRNCWKLHVCCVRLHTPLHVVTCYFVLLGVVASVCTPLLTRTQRLPTLLFRLTLLCSSSCDVTQRLCLRMFVGERFV